LPKGELFDVTPFAEALTRYFLRHLLSSSLPPKFKIAFEGCTEDHAFTAIHDLGLKARIRGTNGAVELGFRITVGGGTATLCRSGNLLHEFARPLSCSRSPRAWCASSIGSAIASTSTRTG
jgi:sulfite reductase beta subunit-like hemoprotein